MKFQYKMIFRKRCIIVRLEFKTLSFVLAGSIAAVFDNNSPKCHKEIDLGGYYESISDLSYPVLSSTILFHRLEFCNFAIGMRSLYFSKKAMAQIFSLSNSQLYECSPIRAFQSQ